MKDYLKFLLCFVLLLSCNAVKAENNPQDLKPIPATLALTAIPAVPVILQPAMPAVPARPIGLYVPNTDNEKVKYQNDET